MDKYLTSYTNDPNKRYFGLGYSQSKKEPIRILCEDILQKSNAPEYEIDDGVDLCLAMAQDKPIEIRRNKKGFFEIPLFHWQSLDHFNQAFIEMLRAAPRYHDKIFYIKKDLDRSLKEIMSSFECNHIIYNKKSSFVSKLRDKNLCWLMQKESDLLKNNELILSKIEEYTGCLISKISDTGNYDLLGAFVVPSSIIRIEIDQSLL